MIAGVSLLPRQMKRPVRREMLRQRLDALVATFDISTITPDPLQLVLGYDDPLDQEVAGLLAAAFAYGRADIVVANVGGVLERMDPSPFAYLAAFDPERAAADFAGFAHRFHKTAELVALLERIAVAITTYSSLGELFRQCYDDTDADIGPSLARFVDALLGRAAVPAAVDGRLARRHKSAERDARRMRAGRPLSYLLTSPNDGSACK